MTGNGRVTGYRVEARCNALLAGQFKIGTVPITESWRTLHFDRAEIGVPNHIGEPLATDNGLLTYEAANALMAWAAASHWGYSIEYRLVEYELTFHYETKEIGATGPINFIDRRRAEKFTPKSDDERQG